jgi:hypothetical protein
VSTSPALAPPPTSFTATTEFRRELKPSTFVSVSGRVKPSSTFATLRTPHSALTTTTAASDNDHDHDNASASAPISTAAPAVLRPAIDLPSAADQTKQRTSGSASANTSASTAARSSRAAAERDSWYDPTYTHTRPRSHSVDEEVTTRALSPPSDWKPAPRLPRQDRPPSSYFTRRRSSRASTRYEDVEHLEETAASTRRPQPQHRSSTSSLRRLSIRDATNAILQDHRAPPGPPSPSVSVSAVEMQPPLNLVAALLGEPIPNLQVNGRGDETIRVSSSRRRAQQHHQQQIQQPPTPTAPSQTMVPPYTFEDMPVNIRDIVAKCEDASMSWSLQFWVTIADPMVRALLDLDASRPPHVLTLQTHHVFFACPASGMYRTLHAAHSGQAAKPVSVPYRMLTVFQDSAAGSPLLGHSCTSSTTPCRVRDRTARSHVSC